MAREGGFKIVSDAMGKVLDVLRHRRGNYHVTFLRPTGQAVLQDLARFCRANETCFHSDPRLHAVAEGRREVWLRIQQHLNLSSQELYQLYSGQAIRPGEYHDDPNQ